MLLKVANCEPRKKELLGATLAEQHMDKIYSVISEKVLSPGTTCTLDFAGIESINGSYIRASVFWLFLCGQLSTKREAQEVEPRHKADPRPSDVFVIVAGLKEEVKREFQEFLKPRNVPLLHAVKFGKDEIEAAELLGHLDSALQMTLNAVAELHSVTAPELHKQFPSENISVTAWNNRLSDLHSLRLIQRDRAGRAWEYKSIARKIIWV